MSEEHFNFYEPTSTELSDQKIRNIFKVIHNQEEYMKNLLGKYKDLGVNENEGEGEQPEGLKKNNNKKNNHLRKRNQSETKFDSDFGDPSLE